MSRTLVICCTDEESGILFSLVRKDSGTNDFDRLLIGDSGETTIHIRNYYTRFRPTVNTHQKDRVDFATAHTDAPIADMEEFRRSAKQDGWTFLDEAETGRTYPEFMKALASDIE